MNRRFVILAASALVCASCVTSYKEPPASSPFATVVFKTASTPARQKAAAASGLGVYQEYGMVEGAACRQYERAATFLYGSGANQSRRVQAGATAYVVGMLSRTRSEGAAPVGSSAFSMGSCDSFAEFTPVAGHVYDIAVDEMPGRVCAMQVTDTASGKAPDDLSVHDNFNCAFFAGKG
jgi:hypothetical protein